MIRVIKISEAGKFGDLAEGLQCNEEIARFLRIDNVRIGLDGGMVTAGRWGLVADVIVLWYASV